MSTNNNIYRIVIPGLIGNVLEWYDFALYGYFASIISPMFFPAKDLTISTIATFAVFAIGFIMRPLGALLFGYFGDKYGRKNSLSAAILLMAIPTTLIGCLPSYQKIGVSAPLFLILFRLLQGLAVGGEFTGSIVYIIEHSPKKSRAFYGSLAMSSAFVGLLLGSLAALFVHRYFPHSEHAWRVPFLLSLFLGGVGLYLRLGMPESPVFEKFIKQSKAVSLPFIEIFKTHWRTIIKAICLVMLPSCGFYTSFVYLPNYIKRYLGMDIEKALLANTLTMLVLIFFIPVCGLFADRYGRRRVLLTGAFGFMVLMLPGYYFLGYMTTYHLYLSLVIFALLVALSYSTIPVVLVEMFPTSVRFTGMSFPYNVANAAFGGTAPLVSSALIHQTGSLYAPAFYLSGLALITFIVAYLHRDRIRENL